MCASPKNPHKRRPRIPAPMILPDDLYDYVHDDPRRGRAPRPSGRDDSDDQKLLVVDDWSDRIPVTEAEVDVFERYFGELLDRLFCPTDPPPRTKALQELTSDVNDEA